MQSHLSQQQKTALQEKLIGKTANSVLSSLSLSEDEPYDPATGRGFHNFIETTPSLHWVPIRSNVRVYALLQINNSNAGDDYLRPEGSFIATLKRSIEYQINNGSINNEEKGRVEILRLIKKFIAVSEQELNELQKEEVFKKFDHEAINKMRDARIDGGDNKEIDGLLQQRADALNPVLFPVIDALPKKFEQALIKEGLLPSVSLAKDDKHSPALAPTPDPAPTSKSAAAVSPVMEDLIGSNESSTLLEFSLGDLSEVEGAEFNPKTGKGFANYMSQTKFNWIGPKNRDQVAAMLVVGVDGSPDGEMIKILKENVKKRASEVKDQASGKKIISELLLLFFQMVEKEIRDVLYTNSFGADKRDQVHSALQGVCEKYRAALAQQKFLGVAKDDKSNVLVTPAMSVSAAAAAAKTDHKLVASKKSDAHDKDPFNPMDYHVPKYEDTVDEKFIALTKVEKPIDATYLEKVRSQLAQVWTHNVVRISLLRKKEDYTRNIKQLNLDFYKLSNLVAEALTIRLSYNTKKKYSLNKDAMPFTVAEISTGQPPENKKTKKDDNIDFIREIEQKALNCLLDSKRTPVEAYNDLLHTLNDVRKKAQAQYASRNKAGNFFGWKSDLTTVIDASIEANKFQPIPAADAPQANYKI